MGSGTTCGNCKTENELGADFCKECGEPLTGAGGAALREEIDAQKQGGILGSEPADTSSRADRLENDGGITAGQMPPR
jgi:hypothetical protein